MASKLRQQFSHTQTWQKLKQIQGIRCLAESAMTLYCLLLDGDVPAWVKAVCVSALCYLVLPMDSVPDAIPLLGHSDDLLCLSSAIVSLNGQIRPHHKEQAKDLFEQL